MLLRCGVLCVCSRPRPAPPTETAGAIYDVRAEYERQDVFSSQHWRITDANSEYAVRACLNRR